MVEKKNPAAEETADPQGVDEEPDDQGRVVAGSKGSSRGPGVLSDGPDPGSKIASERGESKSAPEPLDEDLPEEEEVEDGPARSFKGRDAVEEDEETVEAARAESQRVLSSALPAGAGEEFDEPEEEARPPAGTRKQGGEGGEAARGNRQAPRRDYDRRRPAQSVVELFEQDLSLRAQGANSRLRAQLMGTIEVSFSDSGRSYLFDWTGDQVRISQGGNSSADCTVRMTEQTALKIASGELNPQMAMLSDKIHVAGKLTLAIYFFNLFASRSVSDRSAVWE